MKPVVPYLFFNGNCREAMNFYKSCFGGQTELLTYKDSDGKHPTPAGAENRIMHGFLKAGTFSLMASDTPDNDSSPSNGEVQLYVECDSGDELEMLFEKLSAKGEVFQKPQDTFWGARFAMLTDRYEFRWMLSFRKP